MKRHPIHRAVRQEFVHAALIGGLGAAWIIAFLTVGTTGIHSIAAILPLAVGIALLAWAWRIYEKAKVRWHGIFVESKSVRQATKILGRQGWDISAGVATPFGDIDLVASMGSHRIPIEIKSFRTWTRDRATQTLPQVERQRQWLHANHGFIWLPDAKAGWWRRRFGTRHGNSTVVYGHARHLSRLLRRRGRVDRI